MVATLAVAAISSKQWRGDERRAQSASLYRRSGGRAPSGVHGHAERLV